MKVMNDMSLRIKAMSVNESFARSAVAAFCVQCNPTLEQINDIKTAVSEAVTNSIVHGYEGRDDGEIWINAAIYDGTVYIDIIDEGCGISDIALARRAFYTTKPEQERSGMGFTVMESFMDSLRVTANERGGVKVSMTKKIADVDHVKTSAEGVPCAGTQ